MAIQATGSLPDRGKARNRILRHILNFLLLLILLGLFMLGFNRVIAYEDGITRENFTIAGPLPVPVLEMRPAAQETSLVAIVAHGFSGSKELMTGFGAELAHAGITTYLLDLPGHGQSPAPSGSQQSTRAQENVMAVSEAVAYVRTHNRATKHPALILLGHSMGSVAVADYIMAHPENEDVISTILVSPVGQEQPTLVAPKNLLLLVGQNDLPAALSNSERLLRRGCDLADTQPLPHTSYDCGNIALGTGRHLAILPGLNHLTILNANSTFSEMLTWLHHSAPQVKTTGMYADIRLFWLLLSAGGIVLALFPLCALLIDIFAIQSPVRIFSGWDVFFFDVCLLVGIAAAIALQYYWQPLSFMHILLADYVSGYFFITALIVAPLIFLLRRFVPIPSFKQALRQILLGVLLALFLYCTLGQLSTFAWQRFAFSMSRLWRFAVIFLLILPLFLLDEGIHRGYQARRALPAILSGLGVKLLLVAGLFIALFITPGLGFLAIILPILTVLFLVLAGYCLQLYTGGHAALAGAIMSALVISWCMSTTFPLIG